MTVAEFIGCTFLAFGPPFAMFLFTIVHDPIRIIILISAAFFWLCSLLASALLWFIVVPLRGYTVYGLVASVLIQVEMRQCRQFGNQKIKYLNLCKCGIFRKALGT